MVRHVDKALNAVLIELSDTQRIAVSVHGLEYSVMKTFGNRYFDDMDAALGKLERSMDPIKDYFKVNGITIDCADPAFGAGVHGMLTKGQIYDLASQEYVGWIKSAAYEIEEPTGDGIPLKDSFLISDD